MKEPVDLFTGAMKIITAVMIAGALILSIKEKGGIQQMTEEAKQQKAEERFYIPDINTGTGTIIVDRETGVCYYFKKSMYAGGMTILVDAEGKPIIWKEEHGQE